MKTPKRPYETTFLEWGDEFQGRLSERQQETFARWKRKNRVRQLKHTIARLTGELDNMDTCREIARMQLGKVRDFLLMLSRQQKDRERKADLLEIVGHCNLFLSLSMSPEELDREFKGEHVQPYTLQLTEEERNLMHERRESEV